MQTVADLDDQHARIVGHGDDHLPDGLGFRRSPQGHLVQLRHAINKPGHFGPEVAGQILQRVIGILHRIVQECCNDGGGIHADFRGDRSHG